jgi:hypothetical protein
MKSNRRSAIVLATVVGLAGVGVGTVVGPAVASAATSSTDQSVGGRLTAIKQALEGLVKDGTINQSQADKVADTLDKNLPRGGGPGHGGRFGADLDAAAKAIGISADDLRTALQGGRTLAQVAKDKGVDQATLVDELVTAAKARLADDVKAGRISQAQSDQLTADLKTRITEQVTSTRPAGGPGGRGGHGFGSGRPPGGPEGSTSTTTPSS